MWNDYSMTNFTELIASRWVSVILGINKPFVVEIISKAAETSGVVLPIPT